MEHQAVQHNDFQLNVGMSIMLSAITIFLRVAWVALDAMSLSQFDKDILVPIVHLLTGAAAISSLVLAACSIYDRYKKSK